MEAGFTDLVPGASADGYCFLFKYDICSGKDDNVILQNDHPPRIRQRY